MWAVGLRVVHRGWGCCEGRCQRQVIDRCDNVPDGPNVTFIYVRICWQVNNWCQRRCQQRSICRWWWKPGLHAAQPGPTRPYDVLLVTVMDCCVAGTRIGHTDCMLASMYGLGETRDLLLQRTWLVLEVCWKSSFDDVENFIEWDAFAFTPCFYLSKIMHRVANYRPIVCLYSDLTPIYRNSKSTILNAIFDWRNFAKYNEISSPGVLLAVIFQKYGVWENMHNHQTILNWSDTPLKWTDARYWNATHSFWLRHCKQVLMISVNCNFFRCRLF